MGNLGITASPSVIIKLLNVLSLNASVLVLAAYYVRGIRGIRGITEKESDFTREWPSC